MSLNQSHTRDIALSYIFIHLTLQWRASTGRANNVVNLATSYWIHLGL